MPIYIHPTNFIINKEAVSLKYLGGIEQFRIDFINESEPFNQEDNQLFSISRWNVDGFDINRLINKGLTFNQDEQYSNDFTIYQRLEGFLWKVDWIRGNSVFAWHPDCNDSEILMVEEIGLLTMDEIGELIEKGQQPLTTIRH